MKNTVIIDLVEYNDLRDFKKAIKEGKRLVLRKPNPFGFSIVEEFFTDSEIAKTYIEEIKKLQERIRLLECQNEILQKEKPIQATLEVRRNWFQRLFYREKDVIFSPENFKFDIERFRNNE